MASPCRNEYVENKRHGTLNLMHDRNHKNLVIVAQALHFSCVKHWTWTCTRKLRNIKEQKTYWKKSLLPFNADTRFCRWHVQQPATSICSYVEVILTDMVNGASNSLPKTVAFFYTCWGYPSVGPKWVPRRPTSWLTEWHEVVNGWKQMQTTGAKLGWAIFYLAVKHELGAKHCATE